MKKGFLFISNSTKPSKVVYESLEPFTPGSFSIASICAANKMGWELHMGINRKYPNKIKSLKYDIKFYNQNIYRKIFAFKDLWKAYKNLCNYLNKNPNIEIIHSNTPIGGVIGRIVGHKFKKKVIYTAHGFHFYKGAPILNWILFYPIEKFLARWTDVLITINKEDYAVAQKIMGNNGKKSYYVPGVGVDLEKFQIVSNEGQDIRKELKLKNEDILIIAIGRLDRNKNNSAIIKALSKLKQQNVHLALCGEGEMRAELERLCESFKLTQRVHFLGIRKDIPQILKKSDIFVLASFREGLSRSIMEAMAAGLPCVVSDIRGNRDLIEDGKGGHLANPKDASSFADAITKLVASSEKRNKMGEWNKNRIKQYDVDIVQKIMIEIYSLLNSQHQGSTSY